MRRRAFILGAVLAASIGTARAQAGRDSLALQNAYLLAQAMNEHKAEIGPALKRSMMAMSEADKAKLEERARTERMPFQALAVLQTVAPFAGVSVTDYEAFRAYLQMSGMGK
jgi:hypothetical protein